MLRFLALYTSLAIAANAASAAPVDWQAIRDAGLPKLIEATVAPAPETEFFDADGDSRKLSDWRGQVVLLNFWAVSCAPCREEMPSLDALQRQRGGDRFQVLTVATGLNPPAAIKRFFAEQEISDLPHLTDPRMALARAFGVMAMPVSVLIDAEGNEIARMTGDADWASPAALTLVDQLLAE